MFRLVAKYDLRPGGRRSLAQMLIEDAAMNQEAAVFIVAPHERVVAPDRPVTHWILLKPARDGVQQTEALPCPPRLGEHRLVQPAVDCAAIVYEQHIHAISGEHPGERRAGHAAADYQAICRSRRHGLEDYAAGAAITTTPLRVALSR